MLGVGGVTGNSRPRSTVFICTEAWAPLLRDDLEDQKEQSQEKVVDRGSSALTSRFAPNGRPEGGRAVSRVTQGTAFAPGARRQRWKRQIGLKQTNKCVTTKILAFQSSGLSYLQVVSLKC